MNSERSYEPSRPQSRQSICLHTYSKDVDDIESGKKITLLDPVVSRIAFSHESHRDNNTIQYYTRFIYIVGNTKQYNISYE